MQLALRVKSFCGRPPPTPHSLSFTSFPIVIGRSINCDFKLEDPSRYISSNHAVISFDDNKLRVQDCSSNGVFINNSSHPIGRFQSATVEHGQLISIGDYTLEILLDTAKESSNAPNKPASADPFDVFENTDVFTNEQSKPSASPAQQNLDPFASDAWHKGIGEANPEAPAVKPTPAARSAAAAQETVAVNVTPNQRSADPWDEPNNNGDLADGSEPPLRPAPDYGRKRAKAPPFGPKRNRPHEPIASASRSANASQPPDLKAFLEGAGLDQQQIHLLYTSLDMRQAGSLLAQLTEGMMDMLQARAKIKHAIRSNMTSLAKTHNNPLKFSYSTEEALTKLLSKSSEPGYLPAKQAVKQAAEDLNLHQLAMLEGMKAAVASLVREFDPANLEEKLASESPISASIPGRKQAKLWESFEERYAVLRDEAVHDFDELFGREFRKAYERKIKELGRSPDF